MGVTPVQLLNKRGSSINKTSTKEIILYNLNYLHHSLLNGRVHRN